MNPEINDHARSPPSYRNCTISFFPTVIELGKNVPTAIAIFLFTIDRETSDSYILYPWK